MDELVLNFRRVVRGIRRYCSEFCSTFDTEFEISSKIPDLVRQIDAVLTLILHEFDDLQKCLVIEEFLNNTIEIFSYLTNEYLVNFAESYIRSIRQKMDSLLRNLESKSATNFRKSPGMIASLQLLDDFYQPFTDGIPNEPIDFAAIVKDGLTSLKTKIVLKPEILAMLHQFYSNYSLIFHMIPAFSAVESFKSSFANDVRTWKVPVEFQFLIDDEKTTLLFQKNATISDAKLKIGQEICLDSSVITITQNEKCCHNERRLISFEKRIFNVSYVPPPPIKYHFQTEVKNVSRFYDFSVKVAQVKDDLAEFLKRDVELKVDGVVLTDGQRLSSLSLKRKAIEVTCLPKFVLIVDGHESDLPLFRKTTLMDILRESRKNYEFFVNDSVVNNMSLPLCQMTFKGKRCIVAKETDKLLRFFELPDQLILQLSFNEDDTVGDAKKSLEKAMKTKFVLSIGEKRLTRLTAPLKCLHLKKYDVITAKAVTDILLEFSLGDEVYEIRCKDTMTVDDARMRLQERVRCNFELFQNNKKLKPDKLLILLKSNRINVTVDQTTYRFQMPDGKYKKGAFHPLTTIGEMKDYFGNILSTSPECLQLSSEGKKLKDSKWLYVVDPDVAVVISHVILYDFTLELRDKSTPKRFPFEASARVADVKHNIAQRSRSLQERFSLIYDEVLLGDDVLLTSLQVTKPIQVVVVPQVIIDLEHDPTDAELIQCANEMISETELRALKEMEDEKHAFAYLLVQFMRCGRNMKTLTNNLSNQEMIC